MDPVVATDRHKTANVVRLLGSDIFHLVINKLDSDSIRTAEHNNNGMKLNCGGGKESTKCRYVAVHR